MTKDDKHKVLNSIIMDIEKQKHILDRTFAFIQSTLISLEANEKLGFPSDLRDYGIGAQILYDLGVRKIRLMTNNPKKVVGLNAHKLEIVEQIPIKSAPNPHNERYLDTKRDKLGHKL